MNGCLIMEITLKNSRIVRASGPMAASKGAEACESCCESKGGAVTRCASVKAERETTAKDEWEANKEKRGNQMRGPVDDYLVILRESR